MKNTRWYPCKSFSRIKTKSQNKWWVKGVQDYNVIYFNLAYYEPKLKFVSTRLLLIFTRRFHDEIDINCGYIVSLGSQLILICPGSVVGPQLTRIKGKIPGRLCLAYPAPVSVHYRYPTFRQLVLPSGAARAWLRAGTFKSRRNLDRGSPESRHWSLNRVFPQILR